MNIVQMYQKMVAWPFGRTFFSWIAAQKAPYFFSIRPVVLDLTDQSSVVLLKKRRRVENHLGTVHAIAMCNACELAFGLTMEAGLAPALRWIPKGMTVRYLKKANSDLRAICHFPQIKNLSTGDHVVKVNVFDHQEQVVMDAEITVYVSERPHTLRLQSNDGRSF